MNFIISLFMIKGADNLFKGFSVKNRAYAFLLALGLAIGGSVFQTWHYNKLHAGPGAAGMCANSSPNPRNKNHRNLSLADCTANSILPLREKREYRAVAGFTGIHPGIFDRIKMMTISLAAIHRHLTIYQIFSNS